MYAMRLFLHHNSIKPPAFDRAYEHVVGYIKVLSVRKIDFYLFKEYTTMNIKGKIIYDRKGFKKGNEGFDGNFETTFKWEMIIFFELQKEGVESLFGDHGDEDKIRIFWV